MDQMDKQALEDQLFDRLIKKEGTLPASPAVKPSGPGRLSLEQRSLWLLHRITPGLKAYLVPCILRLRGPLQAPLLIKTLHLLWKRHELLRSIYPERNGAPVRELLPSDGLLVTESQIREEDCDRVIRREQELPMSLETGPLFRAGLHRISEENHLLTMVLHHINGDGASLDLLCRELVLIYKGLVEGSGCQLAEPEPYASHVAEEELREAGAARRQLLESRLRALRGAPTMLDFVFDKRLPSTFSHRGSLILEPLGGTPFLRRIEQRGQQLRASPFMLFMAAFGVVLSRMTGQEDILVGIPVSLRDGTRYENTLGHFVGTAVVHLNLRGRPTVGELIRRSRNAVLEALSCRELPFEELVRGLCESRNPSRPPLVQAFLSFMEFEAISANSIGDLRVERAFTPRDSSMFELTLDVFREQDSLLSALEYSTDAWEERSVRRLCAQFQSTLETLLGAADDLPVSQLVPAPSGNPDFPAVMEGTALDDAPATVPARLASLAALHPEAPALLGPDFVLSRRELLVQIARRRSVLREEGLKAGEALGMAGAPGLDSVLTLLAGLFEGIVVVPLDVTAPEARLAQGLKASGVRLVWGGALPPTALEKAAASCGISLIRERLPSGQLGDEHPVSPEATAYLLFTSGSTGVPKGVRVSHKALAAHVWSAARAYGFCEQDKALLFSPFHFDASWEQLLAPLVAGASVYIGDGGLLAPAELVRILSAKQLTIADLPPQYLRELLLCLEASPGSCPSRLRLVIAGGEALPSSLVESWFGGPLRQVALVNAYGPTEAVITAVCNVLSPDSRIKTANGIVPIGRALPGRRLFILDSEGRLLPPGMPGELCIAGVCLADGYNGDAEASAQRYPHWTARKGGRWTSSASPDSLRLCRTGDRVRLGPDDTLEFLGRMDRQLKLRGFRIEPGEIEAVLDRQPELAKSIVVVRGDPATGEQLVGYCVPRPGTTPKPDSILARLSSWLPERMIPSSLVVLPQFPLTSSGKIDEQALPSPHAPSTETAKAVATDGLEASISSLWCECLGREQVGLDENFFDLGGHSLLLMRLHSRLVSELGAKVSLVDLFANATVSRMAAMLRGEPQPPAQVRRRVSGNLIAVTGMSGRFPGADTVAELWQNLIGGRESIRFFTPEELADAGISPALAARPDYVPAHGFLPGVREFDAGFFGYTPREAELIDPQQRLFLQEAWHALEDAGIDPERFRGDIGVFGGVGLSAYLLRTMSDVLSGEDEAAAYAASIAGDKDFLTLRVSYKLGLSGPSVNVNTACSSSLVAIHLAAESLLRGECDAALAGGVTLQIPECAGHLYQPGGIASIDGHCRAYAEEATGTVAGSGVALVVLRRLEDALRDGDPIHAILRGSAINNDGSDKAGFTAPSRNRQRDVIRAALDRGGVDARSIRLVEGHGTATPIGDPIEVEALAQAYSTDGVESGSCFLGSIKSNIGHLDTAAGVAGFIKAVLAVENGVIPPSLHASLPSTRISFAKTPFVLATTCQPWPGSGPRRAAVSSFGMGGTNAHAIVEQAPQAAVSASSKPEPWCLPLSAPSSASLLGLAARFAEFLEASPKLDPSSVWLTLAKGRRRFSWRLVVIADTREEAVRLLRSVDEAACFNSAINQDLNSPGARAGKGLRGLSSSAQAGKLSSFAQHWLDGAELPLELLPQREGLRKCSVPGTVFDRQEYWLSKKAVTPVVGMPAPTPVGTRLPFEDWFYLPDWERQTIPRTTNISQETVVVVHAGSSRELLWLKALRDSGLTFVEKQSSSLSRIPAPENGEIVCLYLPGLAWAPCEGGACAERLLALCSDLRALLSACEGSRLSLLVPVPCPGAPGMPADPSAGMLEGLTGVIPFEYGQVSMRMLRVDPEPPAREWLRILPSLTRLPAEVRVLALSPSGVWRRKHRRIALEDESRSRLRHRGVYVITGGFGGIGLTLARYLAKHYQARLVLVSRRGPGPGTEQVLRELVALGAEASHAAIDVADSAALSVLFAELRASWGGLHGVIHAAGLPGGSLLARTRLEDIQAVLRPKVQGTLALDSALKGHEPDFVLLCSSLTSVLGGPGQAAYAAANSWLDSFAELKAASHPGRWISVQWDAWSEVGMAARAAGVETPVPVGDSRTLLEMTISPDSYWPWGEHRVDGVAMLPGTACLDLLVRATGSALPVELHAVTLTEPLAHQGEPSRVLRIQNRGGDLSLHSLCDGKTSEHARCSLHPPPVLPALEPLSGLRQRLKSSEPLNAGSQAGGIRIDAGPRWRVTGEAASEGNELLATLSLESGDTEGFILHPGLLDVALSHVLARHPEAFAMLPWRYEALRVFQPLPARIHSHARIRTASDYSLVVDVDLRGESGELLVQVLGYTLVRPKEESAKRQGAVVPQNQEAIRPDEGVSVFLSALDSGAAVLGVSTVDWSHASRPLAGHLLQAASFAASGSSAPNGEASPSVASQQAAPRPAGAVPFRGPKSSREKLMAEVWSEVLGYGGLGVDDDLAALGADSLIALQASARLKQLTGHELSMERFFANPTIAHLAMSLPEDTPVPASEPGRVWEEGEL